MTHQEATLKRFLSTTNKITSVSAHPVQPWIALADKNSGAQIWNWQSGEILYTAQFGGVDESAMHYHSLQKMAEVDPAYWGAKVSQEQSVSKTPSGKLKTIEFLDVETLYWQAVSQLSFTNGRSGEIMEGKVPGGAAVRRERWLIFVCENKILFHELLSHKSHELSKIALDSKNPNCIALLPGKTQEGSLDDACIAIGCNDGTIRVVSFSTFKTVARLGYKSAPVTCLMALHTSPTATLLVSGSQEGTLCLWDAFPTVGAAGGSLPPITTVSKAHDGEIISIVLGFSSPYSTTPGIFTLGRPLPNCASLCLHPGGDRAIGIYGIQGLKNLTKFRGQNQKVAFHSMDVCQPLEASPEKAPVVLASQNLLHSTSVAGGAFHRLCDPAATMPTGLKKAPKIYHFVLHPLQRQLAILALSSGVMVVRIPTPYMTPAVALPVPKTPRQSLEVTCVRIKSHSVLQTEFMLIQQEGVDGGPARSIPETILDKELMEISDVFGTGGHHQLVLAPDASKLAVVRTDVNRFIILANTGVICSAFEGQGSTVVWNATSDKVAVLDIPPPMPAQASQRSLARLRSRTDSTQSINVDMALPASIKVYTVGKSDPQGLAAGGNVAVMLHGGPLLGVTSAAPAGSSNKALTFYSWSALQPCSNEMLAPDWLQWSGSFDLCCLAYSSHVLLCQIGERFQPLMSLPVRDSVHGLWEGDLFYVATLSSVDCVVIQRSKQIYDTSTIVRVQVVPLASFQDGPNWLTGEVESNGGAQKPRPIGHLSILSASKQKVWVMDTRGRPATIDLSYPGFLALAHATNEEYSAAREVAVGKLPADALGQMLLSMGSKSAVEALKLPGLSLPLRLRTAIDAGYLKHALVCLQAIVQGCQRPEAVIRLPEFRDTLKEKLPTPKRSPVAEVLSVSPFSSSEAAPSAPTDLTTAISGDTIDWEIPLRAFTNRPSKKLAVDVSRDVLQLAIALHDASVEERLYDVADSAAAILIQHCDEARDGDLLVQLETRLSSREQTKKLKDLISLTEKAKKSCNGQLRGLMAAALSGDAMVLSEALQDFGMT